MPFYRKKPVVIQALRLESHNISDVIDWIGDPSVTTGIVSTNQIVTIIIPTLEGNMIASEGDYIIKGVHGEFYPCKPDIFWETYEEV